VYFLCLTDNNINKKFELHNYWYFFHYVQLFTLVELSSLYLTMALENHFLLLQMSFLLFLLN